MKIVKVDEIVSMWQADAPFKLGDPDALIQQALKIPNLHAKYTEMWVAHDLAKKDKEYQYDKLRKVKFEYYSGKMDQEELKRRGWEPFRFLLKGDVREYVDADDELMDLKARIGVHETALEALKLIIKEIQGLNYHVRLFVDHAKFSSGL